MTNEFQKFATTSVSIANGPTIEFAFEGAVGRAECAGAKLLAEAIDDQSADLRIVDTAGDMLASIRVYKLPLDENITISVIAIGSALLWSHANYVAAQAKQPAAEIAG